MAVALKLAIIPNLQATECTMNLLKSRLLVLAVSLEACVSTTGCFSCTDVHTPPPQVSVAPAPAPVVVQPAPVVVEPHS